MGKRNLVLLSVLLFSPAAFADRGSIPHKPSARIFEPAQRSIIAWNGETEVLLLSTDMKASEDTRVLEILPLPAEPKVKKGSLETFRMANRLIAEHYGPTKGEGADLSAGGRESPRGPAAEITFHEKIGAHDISVAKVLDSGRFSGWVSEFVAKNGMEGLKIPKAYLDLIEAYLKDRFQWFVLDVVDLKTETRTLDPIQYTFPCPYLYYPLRISSPEEGRTDIRIIVLTPKLLGKFKGLPMSRVKLEHKPFQIEEAQIEELSADMGKLLKGTRPYLRIWRCEGELRELTKDLIVYDEG